jgi:hypothetical protein
MASGGKPASASGVEDDLPQPSSSALTQTASSSMRGVVVEWGWFFMGDVCGFVLNLG